MVLVPTVFLGGGSSSGLAAAGAAANAADTAGSCTYFPTAGSGGATAGGTLSAGQLQIAAAAIGVVKQRRLPVQAAIDMLAAGMQESSLTNLAGGDRDSVGWLQQRPSQGWGTVSQIEDPVYAAGQFLDRLVSVPDWQHIAPAAAIQAVQRSADGSLYTRWVPLATALAASLLGDPSVALACSPGGGGAAPGPAPTAAVGVVLARARAALGLPYCWGGGNANGPSHGFGGPGCGGQTVGFDCSGLVLYAWAGAGVRLDHTAASQYTSPLGTLVPLAQARPGDVVFLSTDASIAGIHHSAILWSAAGDTNGSGQIIEAPDYHLPVRIRAWRGTANPQAMPYALRLSPATGA